LGKDGKVPQEKIGLYAYATHRRLYTVYMNA